MSVLEILDTLLLKPLYLLFEVVYVMADKVIGNPGLSIIVLSLFMNFLVLPLYMRADAIQEEEHAVEKKLQKGVEHIKKTFSGDERMMMLQTYYRQNHYKPMYVLRSAVSLFLQIPFFIAAYRFLSGLELLNGVSFGPIADLSKPDGMLLIGGVSVNILPIVMTVVNLVSCVIFTKGSPLKSKIQLYAMALFFLVFLYTSPAGLVFYWTLNNVFSLIKTIFYKLKNPVKVLEIIFSACGIGLLINTVFFYRPATAKRMVAFVVLGLLLQMPLLLGVLKKRIKRKAISGTGDKKLFLAGGLFLSVLTGALIPSAVIKASPLEFVDITYFYSPIWFIVCSLCMAVGIFVIWVGVFYFLAEPSVRVYFDRAIWMISGVAILDYLFFGKNLGILSSRLKYNDQINYTQKEQIVNAIAVAAALLVLYVIYRFREKLASEILAVGTLALVCMTFVNLTDINRSVNSVKEKEPETYMAVPEFTLSRTEKNVIVLMLDQAMGEYIPYFIQEKPELKEQFSGFTYYANTVSFGAHTNFGTPALFGGYEYTPVEMNKRSEESLASKQNEALKVMPVLFDRNGYQVTICDPPYAGYEWIPDLSIYDEYPEMQTYIAEGKFTDDSIKGQWIQDDKRDFFCYSLFKTAPLCLQGVIYDYGRYNKAVDGTEDLYTKQMRNGMFTSVGMSDLFMDSYNVLTALPNITNVADDGTDTFLMMVNETTHEPMLLQEPDYIPALEVDNTKYEAEHQERYTLNGNTIRMATDVDAIFYQTNMATLLQLGKWFDYMREEGVYDNTRIILVADHGKSTPDPEDELRLGETDIRPYYPLLMVKDFNSEKFAISDEFMTNGDVPALAIEGIVKDAVNPFTGKQINSDEKTAHDQYIIYSEEWDIKTNNGNTYHPAKWYAVHDDMRNPDNWRLVAENAILPPE